MAEFLTYLFGTIATISIAFFAFVFILSPKEKDVSANSAPSPVFETSIPTRALPTSTPTPIKKIVELENYDTEMSKINEKLQTANSLYVQASNLGARTNFEEARTYGLLSRNVINEAIADAEKIDVPTDMYESHKLYQNCLNRYSLAVESLIKGVETLDVNKLNESKAYVEEAQDYLKLSIAAKQ